MSQSKNFTVRLSEADQQILKYLADRFNRDRSATMRQALRTVFRSQNSLSISGVFTSLHLHKTRFTVQIVLSGAENHD